MKTKLTYHQEGDYLIPDLVPPESPRIGVWGERRRQFLRRHRKPLYSGLLMSGTLNAHLEEIDRVAQRMFDGLTAEMAKREGITKAMKAANQMKWVQKMNTIRFAAEEIVCKEWIETE